MRRLIIFSGTDKIKKLYKKLWEQIIWLDLWVSQLNYGKTLTDKSTHAQSITVTLCIPGNNLDFNCY